MAIERQVERFNKVIKETLQLAKNSNLCWKKALLDRLTSYRMTPYTATGYSPFELLRGWKFPSMLIPWWLRYKNNKLKEIINKNEVKTNVKSYQERKFNITRASRKKGSQLHVGQSVRIKLPGLITKGKSKWSDPVRIIEVHKKSIRVEDGRLWNLRRVAVFHDNIK